MSAFSFLALPPDLDVDRGSGPAARYPSIARGRGRSKQSVLTLVAAASLALAASVIVSAVAFTFADPDAASELVQRYGRPSCPHGHSMYREPINNYAPCCSHYAATCCDLHGDTCIQKFDYASYLARNRSTLLRRRLPSGANSATTTPDTAPGSGPSTTVVHLLPKRCTALLSLLACARCSPFAGHFVRSPTLLVRRPNLTVCESFCHSLYEACRPTSLPSPPPSQWPARSGLSAEKQPHLLFCTLELGLRVGGRQPRSSTMSSADPARRVSELDDDDDGGDELESSEDRDATCFAAAQASASHHRWLSWGVPLALALLWNPHGRSAGLQNSVAASKRRGRSRNG